jgi:biopolymer transport protein ExbD
VQGGAIPRDIVCNERDINLTVPEVNANAPLTAAPAKKIINVFADGQITIDRRNVTLPELTKELVTARSEYEGLGVLVRGDAQSVFQTVAEVLITWGQNLFRVLRRWRCVWFCVSAPPATAPLRSAERTRM